MRRYVWTIVIVGMAVCRWASAQQDPAPFSLQTALQNAVDAPPPTASTSTTGATPAPTVSPIYHDAQGRIVVQGDYHGNYGMCYPGNLSDFCEVVDAYGNRTHVVKRTSAMPQELKHEFIDHSTAWYERFATDASGGLLLSSADTGESTVADKAAQFGIQVGYPDWLRIDFAKATTINEVDVITLQDNYTQGIRPLRASEPGGPTTFTLYGTTDYEVQYLNASYAWVAVPGGYVTNNRDVARAFIFAPITTTAIRLVVKGGLASYSRVVEVEAFEQSTHRNAALASQGGSATASSAYPGYSAAGAINGDETGKLWGSSGGWNDNTPDVVPAAGTVTSKDLGNNYSQKSYSNQFAGVVRTINNNAAPTSIPQYQSFLLERDDVTYASGWHTFSAGAYMTSNGIEYWDNSGGSRIEYSDPVSKKLFYVSDWCDGYGTRPVVRINRDSQGRPTDVYLGDDVALIQFVYDSQGWLYTRLIDRTTHTAVYGIIRSSAPVTHYPDLTRLTNGFMPEYGPIVEWHDSISATPNIICSIQNTPYALLRNVQTGFASGEAARYVIYPFKAERDPITDIRVEYNATDMYVYLPTLNSGTMALRQDFTNFVIKRASWMTAENSTSAGSQDRIQPLPDTPSLEDSLATHAAIRTSHPRPRSHKTKLRTAKGRIQAGRLSKASSQRPARVTTLATKGVGSGDGGSGGADGSSCSLNESGIVICGGVPVTYTGTITTTTTGTGPGSIVILPGPTAPNPEPGYPPGDPGASNSGATNPNTGCGEAQVSASLERNPDASQARNGTTPCPQCPPEDPSKAYPPCKVPPAQSLLDRQLTWAKTNAGRAMQDKKCRAFMLDPVHAKPTKDAPHTYFESAGYYGDFPNVNMWSSSVFDLAWQWMVVYDGTGSSYCPDFNSTCYCGATALTPPQSSGDFFVCPQVWTWWGQNGGGPNMQLALMHEFLHVLGMREQNAGYPPLTYPTSTQIDVALQAACAQAAINAQGTSQPPH